jgi:hypothetical protein
MDWIAIHGDGGGKTMDPKPPERRAKRLVVRDGLRKVVRLPVFENEPTGPADGVDVGWITSWWLSYLRCQPRCHYSPECSIIGEDVLLSHFSSTTHEDTTMIGKRLAPR